MHSSHLWRDFGYVGVYVRILPPVAEGTLLRAVAGTAGSSTRHRVAATGSVPARQYEQEWRYSNATGNIPGGVVQAAITGESR